MPDSTRLYKCTIDMEATYGTGDGAATAIPLTNDSFPSIEKEDVTIPVYDSSLGRSTSYPGFLTWNMPVKFYLKGPTTAKFNAGTASELGKLFRCFGLQETLTALTSQAWKVRDSGHESATFTVNLNGVQYQVTGARGEELKINLEAGKATICEGNVRGLYNAPTLVAYSAPTFADSEVVPQNVASMAMTFNGATHIIPRMSVTIKNVGDYVEDINSPNGIYRYEITGREYEVEGIALRDSSNDLEWWSNLTTPTPISAASTGYGIASGNKYDIDFANFQFTDVKPAEYKGSQAYTFKGAINKHATAASEFQIKIT